MDCYKRFKESIEKDHVMERADDIPYETEWYLVSCGHIYYCPFCCTFIKGKGFGEYDKKYPPVR